MEILMMQKSYTLNFFERIVMKHLINMIGRAIVIVGFICSAINVAAALPEERIIFDTDMGPDYDDVGALAVLHVLADWGLADILATVSSNRMEKTVQLIHCLNTYYGRTDIPIG